MSHFADLSLVLLTITGWLFLQGVLNAVTQTICWSVIFFFASAGASAAYLTVSEVFPLETRALAIALFYSIGTLGGAFAPTVFSLLIQSGKAVNVFYGDLFGAALMAAGNGSIASEKIPTGRPVVVALFLFCISSDFIFIACSDRYDG